MDADFHVHTNTSWCAAGDMTVAAVAEAGARAGLLEIGLSDHLWLDPRRGSRPAVARLMRMRPAAGGADARIVLRLGAEADCAPGMGIAGGADLALLDFAIAADHFSDLRLGIAPWPATPEAFAARLVEGLRCAVTSPHATTVGHPFHVPGRVLDRLPWLAGRHGAVAEVYRLALPPSAAVLADAARRGVKIELNAKALGPRSGRLLLPFFRLAREAGCTLVPASDAHRLAEIGRHRLLADYLRVLGG